MEPPVIDPNKVQALIAGGLGAFMSVLFQRSSNKWQIVTTLVTAEVTCYYLALPVWNFLHGWLRWFDEQWQGPVALTIGLLAIFFVGGVVKIAQEFMADPRKSIEGTIVSILERVLPKKKED